MHSAVVTGVLAGVAGYATVRLLMPPFLKFFRARGITRPDAHKPGRPEVVHAGGVVIFSGVVTAYLTWLLLEGLSEAFLKGAIILSAGLLCFLVGLVDDLKVLGGLTKTALTVLGIMPIAVAALIEPRLINWGRPALPLIGTLRLTVIYWALLPLAVAGPANVVNMLDVLNGVMPGTMLIAYSALAISAAILGKEAALVVSLAVIGVLAAYYPYNAYPARVFNGDSGSLFLGALLGGLAVVEHMEFIALTLLLPHIINGFMVLVSFRGFREHRLVPKRPIVVEEDGTLAPNTDPDAPLTLTRLVLILGGKATEKEVARLYLLLELSAATLALISALLLRGT